MTLPKGWIPNTPAPEVSLPTYTGDPTHNWEGNPPGFGAQPHSDLNPAGTVPSVPVMGITPDIAGKLEGPQPE
jgi:hypothetical protein